MSDQRRMNRLTFALHCLGSEHYENRRAMDRAFDNAFRAVERTGDYQAGLVMEASALRIREGCSCWPYRRALGELSSDDFLAEQRLTDTRESK